MHRCLQALRCWHCAVALKRSLHKLHNSLIQSSDYLLQSHISRRWHELLRVRITQQARIAHLRKRHLHRSAFRRWAAGAVQLGAARASLLAAIQHAAHSRFSCMLAAWHHIASSQKQSRCNLEALKARRCSAALSRVWRAWKGWTTQCTVYHNSLHAASQAIRTIAVVSLQQQAIAVRTFSLCNSHCNSKPTALLSGIQQGA